jgi:hypothetical protein
MVRTQQANITPLWVESWPSATANGIEYKIPVLNQSFPQKQCYSSSALNFSNTEKSSSVVTSPATEPLVAISLKAGA